MDEKYKFTKRKRNMESMSMDEILTSFVVNTQGELLDSMGKEFNQDEKRFAIGEFMRATTFDQAKDFFHKYYDRFSLADYISIFNNFWQILPGGEKRGAETQENPDGTMRQCYLKTENPDKEIEGYFETGHSEKKIDDRNDTFYANVDAACKKAGFTVEEVQQAIFGWKEKSDEFRFDFYKNKAGKIYLKLREMGYSNQDLRE